MEPHHYRIEGMDCVDCALKIEKGVGKLPGIEKVELNFATTRMRIEGTVDERTLRDRVAALGYRLVPDAFPRRSSGQVSFGVGLAQYLFTSPQNRLALLGGVLLLISFVLGWIGVSGWSLPGLQIVALGLAGAPIARRAISNLVINRDFSMDFLMTTAAVGAVLIGEIPEAASLIFLFAIAEALEGYTADRARRSISDLVELAPPMAIRLRAGREENLPVESLQIGDRILIHAGESVAMDGRVVAGESDLNQAPITGESLPVRKTLGDEVFAGTINGSGTLEVEVTHLAQDNTLNRIVRMVEQAQAARAPAQRFIDRFARVYTPAMLVLALLVAILPPLLFGQPFFNLEDGTRGWIYRGLALLVIGCPCALVISTPVTIVSSIAAAARLGVLFKGGAYLEALDKVEVVAFDKTGTLTRGAPQVTAARSVDCLGGEHCLECDDVLALASSLERRSSHPLAQAVVQAAQTRGLSEHYPPAEEVTTLAGMGLQGRVNGQMATIGNHRLFEANHPHSDQLCDWVASTEALGQTTMLVCDGERVRGYLAVSDTLRPESAAVASALKKSGKTLVMLTGDNARAARSIGDALAIDQVFAGLLPEEKVAAVKKLREQYGELVMVGDGINDAPALASASVGIAMGGAGSAQAMETADVVLMSDGLARLPFAFRLAQLTQRLIRQNVVFSLATKLIFILLALGGWTTLWLAVMADMGVSLLVTFNGMRPLGLRDDFQA
jgi:Zn2+/Cd2+-exporting ATPase